MIEFAKFTIFFVLHAKDKTPTVHECSERTTNIRQSNIR
jgi:hypothetical protein